MSKSEWKLMKQSDLSQNMLITKKCGQRTIGFHVLLLNLSPKNRHPAHTITAKCSVYLYQPFIS
jgi:hypothetical protein